MKSFEEFGSSLRVNETYVHKDAPFDEADYERYFRDHYNTGLTNVTYEEAVLLDKSFAKFPSKFIINEVNNVQFDPSLGQADEVFPNHGRWEPEFGTLVLNRTVLDEEPKESLHLITHEIGHALDSTLDNISQKPEWMTLSGWVDQPEGVSIVQQSDDNYLEHGSYERLKIKEKNMLMVANWWHLKSAKFVRWYAGRNPMEDFAECVSYYVLGETERFKGCEDKLTFVKKILDAYKK